MVNTDESRNVDDLDKSMTISLTSKISSGYTVVFQGPFMCVEQGQSVFLPYD